MFWQLAYGKVKLFRLKIDNFKIDENQKKAFKSTKI